MDVAAVTAADVIHTDYPRPMNERMWFGRIVASYKFTSGGSEAISTATLATSSAAIT
jgi:hypothetical protein